MRKIKNHLLSIMVFMCLASFSTVQAKEVLRIRSVWGLWNQQVKRLQAIGADIGYILPKEGTLAWLDCWSITSGVKNKTLAEAWINFTLEKKALAMH